MSNFDFAFEKVIGHEGGYQNDYADRGNWTSGNVGVGEQRGTKYGISAMSYPNEDIPNLTLDRAKEIYKSDYWDRCHCDDLPDGVDYLVFDIGVNHGIRDAGVFLQKSVGATPDGIIGPLTLGSVQRADPKNIIRDLCVYRSLDYAALDHLVARYGKGWYRRVIETLRVADALDQSKGPKEDPKPKPKTKAAPKRGFKRVGT